jgi:hypothetical protein
MRERYYFQKARGAMVVDGYPKRKDETSKHSEVNERTNYKTDNDPPEGNCQGRFANKLSSPTYS